MRDAVKDSRDTVHSAWTLLECGAITGEHYADIVAAYVTLGSELAAIDAPVTDALIRAAFRR